MGSPFEDRRVSEHKENLEVLLRREEFQQLQADDLRRAVVYDEPNKGEDIGIVVDASFVKTYNSVIKIVKGEVSLDDRLT
ncbi:hypothetical protein GOBAR_DD11269 [Gossypium barbadense]|nr:hypothetical protein GOBAR_DD11269 [Gossypium barbadense]